MTPVLGRTRRSWRAFAAALALILVLPASSLGWHDGNTDSPSYVTFTGAVAGGAFVPLINSGEVFDGVTFQGLPDGLGVVPGPGGTGWVDIYVAHEESHVPFGLTATTVFGDFQDSSVTRVRVDLATKAILEMEVALPASAGLIRFCSAFMAGPEHGFPHYTFLVNEESNDILDVPAGAPYGPDSASLGAQRQAGYAAYLDTRTGMFDVIPGAGRHNHENTVVVPGGWSKEIVSLSGDDTFTSTSSPAMPNLSQLYMYGARNWKKFIEDQGALWAFRVTGTGDPGPFDPADPQNEANDFFDIAVGDTWTGEFIPVDPAVARGQTVDRPQDALEIWSNDQNVFQFIRVEDVAYDPDNPRVVYFADTGNSRLLHDDGTGRLWRAPSGTPGTLSSNGRIFKMVFNADDPRVVDEFSVVLDAISIGMRSPDNLDVGPNSLMVQEDTTNAKIWRFDLASTWTHVATVDRDQNPATLDTGESSGILDVSRWFGDGWWALDVQAHDSHVVLDPTSADPVDWHTWTTPPIPPGGAQYRKHLEDGQLLLMYIPGS